MDDDGEYPLSGERNRFITPLETEGRPDEPDEFDLIDRIPEEFGHSGESPQSAGKRARKIERLLAKTDDKVEFIDD